MIILTMTLFCIASLFSYLQLKSVNGNILWFFMGACLFLLAAFRDGSVLADYDVYLEMYKNPYGYIVEISFSLIVWIVKILFDNVIFLFVIYAIIGVSLKLRAIKELSPLIFLSLAIYISQFYILHELIQIRAGVASGFFLLCIKPIYERDLKKFLFFVLCAVLFHVSALIILPLWFLKGYNINKYFYATVIPLACICCFLNINMVELFILSIPIEYVQQKFSYYLEYQKLSKDYSQIGVLNYRFLAKSLVFYVILWKSELVKSQNKYINLLLKIEVLSLASFMLFFSMPVFAYRISEFYGIVEIILIPSIYYIYKPKILSKMSVIVIGFCMILVYVFYVKIIAFST